MSRTHHKKPLYKPPKWFNVMNRGIDRTKSDQHYQIEYSGTVAEIWCESQLPIMIDFEEKTDG